MRRRTRLLLLLVVAAATVAVVTVSNAPADRKQPRETVTGPTKTNAAKIKDSTKDPTKKNKSLQPIGPQLNQAPSGFDDVFGKTSKTSKSDKPRRLLTPAEAERMAVLMDIWKRQGGDIFSGTIFEQKGDESVEEEFADALRRVMTKARAETQSKLTSQSSPAESLLLEPAEKSSTALLDSLQESCRLLDDKANDLEKQKKYFAADALRSLAAKMRETARRLE